MILLIFSLLTATIVNASCELPGNATDKFYDKVLSDYKRKGLFVACEITSPGYKGKVVIENANLYAYFNQKKGLNQKKYKAYMLQKLTNNEKIEIQSEDLLRWRFFKVDEIGTVEKQVKAGIESFIQSFFNGRMIKESVDFRERNAIIYHLFNWQIGCKLDDETGYLYIPELPKTTEQ